MLSAVCLPQVRAEACISLQASWERSKVRRTVRTIFGELKLQETNHSSSNCPKYVRRTNIRPFKNGLNRGFWAANHPSRLPISLSQIIFITDSSAWAQCRLLHLHLHSGSDLNWKFDVIIAPNALYVIQLCLLLDSSVKLLCAIECPS